MLVQHLGAKLTLTSSGNAQLGFHTDDSFAYYLNPGEGLPNPGDPGFDWSGSLVVKDYTTALTSVASDQTGQEVIPFSFPFVMKSGDGSVSQVMEVDFNVVIDFVGNQVAGFNVYQAGNPHCP